MKDRMTAITIPKLGMTMSKAVVGKWQRTVGSSVEAGDVLLQIESDKSTNDCESPRAGILRRIVHGEGAEMSVGALIGVIAVDGVTEAEIDQFIAEHPVSASA